tara:strand:+ start:664 stop:2727 length:2064 start_codon:yes stop_codon:yes gene_type:complete
MATNEIEIEVTLDSRNAERGLNRLEEGGEAVGETFNSVGASVSALGGEMNEKLGAVGESVGGLTESMIGLGSAVMNSGGSFLALIGPIGAVAVALSEVISAYKEYSGETQDIEIRTEAYAAATAELTSTIEEMAAAQVTLTRAQIEELRVLSMRAKVPLETAQGIREANKARKEEINLLDERIKSLRALIREEERLNQTRALQASLVGEQEKLNRLLAKRERLQAALSTRESEAITLTQQGHREMAEFERVKEERLKTGEKAQQERAKREAALLEQARIQELQRNKESAQAQTQIAVIESQKRQRELREIEDIGEDVRAKAIMAEQQALLAKLAEIREADAKRKRSEAQRAAVMRKTAIAKRIAQEKIAQSELARIRRAEIENMRIMGADQLTLLERQQELELELAGNNVRAREAILLEFENRRLTIQQEADRKRQEQARKAAEEEKQRDEQRRALRFDSMRFDLEMMSDGLDKEVALLELRYRREIELTATTEEEKIELQRRAEIERAKIIEEGMTNQLNAIAETTSAISEGLAESAYNAAFFGKSFKESIGEIALSLGRQAAIESLMELARGTAALLLNPAAAANHFGASAIFAAAAGVAGSVGASLGASGGGGSGGAASSPTGSPQTAPTAERERAESNAMVFNINFGNSTIYDTKRAAQDAFAAEIMRTFNRQRRGAPRFAMG